MEPKVGACYFGALTDIMGKKRLKPVSRASIRMMVR